jgi:hypothetical protein
LVILIDEVHLNIIGSRWVYLLKKSISTVVVGVGVPNLDISPQFVKKYPSSEMNFDCKSEDMEELFDAFVKQTKSRGISPDDIAAICHYICDYTSGHMYPMLKFCEHIFDTAQNDYLDNYSKYLTSKKFYDHEDYADVRDRCFSSLPVEPISNILHRGVKTNKDIFALDKLGLWSSKNHWFISKCLVDVIYNTIPENMRVPASKISFGKLSVKKKIETIIIK